MARKIPEIYDFLNVVKASMQELATWVIDESSPASTLDNSETLLEDLVSKSKVAWWRTWLWLVATGSFILESYFDIHRDEIKALLSKTKAMTLPWYAEQSRLWQFGYDMTWKDDEYSYDVIDETARIVTYANASEKNDKVFIKVAKLVQGVKAPLSTLEKNTLQEFWNKWRPAGVKVQVVSLPPDTLKATLTIVRDRLILAGNNSLLRDASVFPINDAVKKFSNSLEFDGKLRLSKFVDAIQEAEGVVDVKLVSASVKPAGGVYSQIDMVCEAESGYFNMSWSESSVTFVDNANVEIQS
jgi:hypothetical protein